ncbi:MAG TPA: hypothetical protein VHE79_14600 [Spirochaetia bacterium]
MSVSLSAREEEELYVLLKPRESSLEGTLDGLLRRVEKELFGRMTIEQIEGLAARFPRDR